MAFFATVAMSACAYFLWRISEHLPDITFRLSELQRDIAEIRRQQDQD